jgi:hypothetical protein
MRASLGPRAGQEKNHLVFGRHAVALFQAIALSW